MGNTIYKFFRTNQFLYDTLISNQLYFSSINQFNDPYDCHLTLGKEIPLERFKTYIKETFKSEEHRKKHLKAFEKDPNTYTNRFLDCFKEFLNYYGICCFSQTRNEPLLWSHYADSHKGVALGFNYKSLKEQYKQYDEVDYNDNPHIFDINDIDNSISKTILRKSTNWKYEREVRFLMERSKSVAFNMASLEEVIFGKKCPKRTRLNIHYLINKMGYQNCKFYESDIDMSEYSLKFKTVNFKELKKEVLDESKTIKFEGVINFEDLLENE